MARFIVNVLDSFGVGAMADVSKVRPRDIGSNTAANIVKKKPDIHIPTLEGLGLMNAIGFSIGTHRIVEEANYGISNLGHVGADSFLGHQELAGTTPLPPLIQAFNEVIDEVEENLKKRGYSTRRVGEQGEPKILVINEVTTVGDNLETDLGQVYNVSAILDYISFEDVKKIGMIVREAVNVSRVIAFGGHHINLENLLAARKVKGSFAGIDAPESGVYNFDYHVIHLGYGIDPKVQIPTILEKENIFVSLIGKTADIIQINQADRFPGVDTVELYDHLIKEVTENKTGFFFINIQETDLAGHAEDFDRYADRLETSDRKIAQLLPHLNKEDILIVTADHGNDPTIGHSNHTREKVPLLIYKKGLVGTYIGERSTMSDVAATAAEFFKVQMPQNGTSFLSKIINN